MRLTVARSTSSDGVDGSEIRQRHRVLDHGQQIQDRKPQTPQLPREPIGVDPSLPNHPHRDAETQQDRRRETGRLKRPEGRTQYRPHEHGNRDGPSSGSVAKDEREGLTPARTVAFLILEILNMHRCEDDAGNDRDPLVRCAVHGVFGPRGHLDGSGAIACISGGEQDAASDIVVGAAEFIVHPVEAGQEDGFLRGAEVDAQEGDEGDAEEEKARCTCRGDAAGREGPRWFVDGVFFDGVGEALVREGEEEGVEPGPEEDVGHSGDGV